MAICGPTGAPGQHLVFPRVCMLECIFAVAQQSLLTIAPRVAGSLACALISAFGALFMGSLALLLARDYPCAPCSTSYLTGLNLDSVRATSTDHYSAHHLCMPCTGISASGLTARSRTQTSATRQCLAPGWSPLSMLCCARRAPVFLCTTRFGDPGTVGFEAINARARWLWRTHVTRQGHAATALKSA